jgi:hypothetical protein
MMPNVIDEEEERDRAHGQKGPSLYKEELLIRH